jgi:hypothetical protein
LSEPVVGFGDSRDAACSKPCRKCSRFTSLTYPPCSFAPNNLSKMALSMHLLATTSARADTNQRQVNCPAPLGRRAWSKTLGPLFFCSCFSLLSTTRRFAFGPFHLITLFARANTSGGIVRPICLAAFKLMTSSNFIGCSTGRSAGFVPFKILSTYVAERRVKSITLAE